jgi:glycosyltransferase involved in cell wall biosynthesis
MKRRVVIDVSNLTIHDRKFIRTGIQEVLYRTLMSFARIRGEFAGVETVLLSHMPKRFGSRFTESTATPYAPTPVDILEQVERDLGLTSHETWGYDLKAEGYHLTPERIVELTRAADHVHFQALVDIGPLCARLSADGARKPRFSMTIYDLIPMQFPEYCDNRIAAWYQGAYLPNVARYVDNAICISRNTAIDVLGSPVTGRIPRVTVLPLPFEFPAGPRPQEDPLAPLGLSEGGYILFLGSLEPRKNFMGLLHGFEAYHSFPGAKPLKLVLVGATGWKNEEMDARIAASPAAHRVVKTGYVEDAELDVLMRRAAAVSMLSFYEGYGLPVAQAFSKGTAVITTVGSSLPEACNGQGIFVDPVDPISVACGIRLASERKGNGPLPPALDNWTWDNYARGLMGAILAS